MGFDARFQEKKARVEFHLGGSLVPIYPGLDRTVPVHVKCALLVHIPKLFEIEEFLTISYCTSCPPCKLSIHNAYILSVDRFSFLKSFG